jgi:hypothetical protein
MQSNPERKPAVLLALGCVLVVRALLSCYWMVRYGGNWMEDDTPRITAAIAAVLESGQVAPAGGRVYFNGFLYPVFSAFSIMLGNVDLLTFQRWVGVPLAFLLSILAFALYYRLLANPAAAAVATILLTLQGDFLFTTNRSTHEKFVFAFVITAFLAMIMAFNREQSLRNRIVLGVVYYLAAFALSTTNVFFASTFMVTLMLSFLIWYALNRYSNGLTQQAQRLIYISGVALIFIYLLIFQLYAPARTLITIAANLTERLQLLLFSFDEPPAVVYQTAGQAWTLPYAWLLLRTTDLCMMLAATWGWFDLLGRLRRGETLRAGYFWLLSLFPAFALQNMFALFSDITGSAADINNLQVRLAPLTAIAAAPLAAYTLWRMFTSLQGVKRRLASGAVSMLTCLAVAIALVKSTSEPLIANTWIFYSPAEAASVRWLNQHALVLNNESGRRSPRIWGGPQFRPGQLWLNNYWGANTNIVPVTSTTRDSYRYVLLSPSIRQLSGRLNEPLPALDQAWRIYDNGDNQLYATPP